jgi:hypothetical protein
MHASEVLFTQKTSRQQAVTPSSGVDTAVLDPNLNGESGS